jgi:Bacterial PH domain
MKHSTMTTFEIERALDLAEPLPDGENVLWLDSPDWKSFALRVFHLKALTIYFGILIAANSAWMASNGGLGAEMLASTARVLALSVAGLAMFTVLAWLMAKSTTYAITNHRVFLRIGVALSITVTVPFKTIRSADLRTYKDGTGDLPLSLTGHDRLAYLHLWPHARPWQLKDTAPMLRAVPNAEKVAEILAAAILNTVNASPNSSRQTNGLSAANVHALETASDAHVQAAARAVA